MPNPGDVATMPGCPCCGSSSSSGSSSSAGLKCPMCPSQNNYQFTLAGIQSYNPGQNCSSLNTTWTVTQPGFFSGGTCVWECPVPNYSCQGISGSYRWELIVTLSVGVYSWRLRLATGTIGDPAWYGTSNDCLRMTLSKGAGEACCYRLIPPFTLFPTFPNSITLAAI